MGKGKLFRKGRIVYLGMVVLVVILNISAWNSTFFSDWYIAHIFPVWVNVYGRVTGLFPFSVGEWMLAAGVISVVVAAALGLLWVVIGVTAGVRGIYRDIRRRKAGLEGEHTELTYMSENRCLEQTGLTVASEEGYAERTGRRTALEGGYAERTGLTAASEEGYAERTGLRAALEGGCAEQMGLTVAAQGGCAEQTGLRTALGGGYAEQMGLTVAAQGGCAEQTGLGAALEGGYAEQMGLTVAAQGGYAEQTELAGRTTEGTAAEESSGWQRVFCGFRCFSRGFGYFFAWTVLVVCLIMTLNCFILYHASTFSQHYFGEDTGEYTLVELIEVYNMVAGQCNGLAGQIERDENGMAVYNGSMGKDGRPLDMEDMARELMRQLGGKYPQLDGYYPRPKALMTSDFMCQQHMQGYYFPFSMEANYNDVMHILNFPSTMCHELAHLRGYIYEDEANFIGYLACVESEDVFFQYAGYLSVLVYLNNDLYRAWKEERAVYEEAAAIVRPVAVDAQVWEDNIFVTEEEWERINGKALIDTEIVDKAADVFIDANLKVNGVADGKVSYSRVVRLLLQYYRLQAGAGIFS